MILVHHSSYFSHTQFIAFPKNFGEGGNNSVQQRSGPPLRLEQEQLVALVTDGSLGAGVRGNMCLCVSLSPCVCVCVESSALVQMCPLSVTAAPVEEAQQKQLAHSSVTTVCNVAPSAFWL